jgi:4-amino-4-deoxy-L-arabinose transferase-like glycosyltransferase
VEKGLPTKPNKSVSVITRWWSAALHQGKNLAGWLTTKARGEKIVLLLLLVGLPLLMFYNLELNPRPWHDEGAYLTLARTIVEDGHYAIRNSEGYQTFGAVQSVGPTVVLPVALSFKLLGVGLVQGRLVAVIFSLITLMCLFLTASNLFDRATALTAVIVLLSSSATGFMIYGRQVLGEIPAFGFFLMGWLLLSKGMKPGNKFLYPLSGVFFGAAIITKNQYFITLVLTFIVLIILDLIYYRTKLVWPLTGALAVSCLCYAAWWGWQFNYYGADVFQENEAKLRQLGSATTYLSIGKIISTLRYFAGTSSGHLYLYWGLPAVIFMLALSIHKSKNGLATAFLFVFYILWMLYMIWSTPWSLYYLAPMAIAAIFIARIAVILAKSLARNSNEILQEAKQLLTEHASPSVQFNLSMGALIALVSFGLWTGYQLQTRIRDNVFDPIGLFEPDISAPLNYSEPHQAAEYLNKNIDKSKTIETWERELGILSNHRFHYPDQSLLGESYVAIFREGQPYQRLGGEYFATARPDFLIIGWYGRHYQLYNPQFIADHATHMITIGHGDWRYDIYQLNLAGAEED